MGNIKTNIDLKPEEFPDFEFTVPLKETKRINKNIKIVERKKKKKRHERDPSCNSQLF